MSFIEHIIEPTRLLVTWQSSSKEKRKRFVIAELISMDEKLTLKYLTTELDFLEATKNGFEPYPAFPDVGKIYESGVLDTFMRRLPPKSRNDYAPYLEGFRIRSGTEISNFALLGYTGAKLPSDGFAIIHPFDDAKTPFEFLLEAAGYRYYKDKLNIEIGDRVTFKKEFDSNYNEEVVKILSNNQLVGYVTRALLPTFKRWMSQERINDAWIEKKNGSIEQPMIYIYVKIGK